MSNSTPIDCAPPGDGENDVPTLDRQMVQGGARVEWLLNTLGTGLKVIERDGQPQLRIELIGAAWSKMSTLEATALSGACNRINNAMRKGAIKLTPGFDSLQMVQMDAALDALAPGIFDARRLEFALTSSPVLLSVVSGQWFPPGVCIELTPAETDKLIALLAAGGALGGFLTSIGVGAPWAAILGAVLALQAAAIGLAKAMSTTGAVGFKITFIPPATPLVVPYPV